jgi:hypothetical protein
MSKLVLAALLAVSAMATEADVIWGRQSTCAIPGMPGTICSGEYYREGINVAVRNEGAAGYLVTIKYSDSTGEHEDYRLIESSESKYTFEIIWLASERVKVESVKVEPIF